MALAKATPGAREIAGERRAVAQLLRDHPRRSNSDIAREVGCGHPFVARVRRVVEWDGPDLVWLAEKQRREREERFVVAAADVIELIGEARAQAGRAPIVGVEVLP